MALFGAGLFVASLLVMLFRKYVAPWLTERKNQIKQEIGEAEYEAMVDMIKTFMAAAEQQLGNGNGKAKSELVISWVKKVFPDVRADYVQALIDGFMQGMTNERLINVK